MIRKWFKAVGPGPLIAAAFIGPGTVTLCTIAGASFGYALLWTMVLSIIATIVLQEMAARLGLITQKGLSEIIRMELQHPLFKGLVIILMISAIVIGNAAYEAGNISGAVLGLKTIFSGSSGLFSVIIGVLAFIVLYIGNYKALERVLIVLVVLMSAAFLISAVVTKPNFSSILTGAFYPTLPEGSWLIIIGLIGTTVVPYNLFLHASLVKEKWQDESHLKLAKRDTILAVILGGVVSMSIIVAAASIQSEHIANASDLAKGLEPLFGSFAKYVMAIGLLAAGITSAITAPLSAAYVACDCLGWSTKLNNTKFRAIWILVLLLGVLSASSGIQSIEIIKFAQIANGLLLPIVAVLLLWIMNKSNLLGKHKNTLFNNIIGILIVAVTIVIGVKSIFKVFELI